MRRFSSPFVLAHLAVLLCVTACGTPGGKDAEGSDSDVASVTLRGALAKGPFVLGSSLTVAPTDDQGHPSGQVFQTQTSDDLGAFEVVFDYRGLTALTANGFYYNEITGSLSSAPIALRGLVRVDEGGEQQAYVNLITHLTTPRILALLGDGVVFDDAVVQAEGELRGVVGLPTGGLDGSMRGADTNLLGGDLAGPRYLFALSTVITQAAALRGASVDAQLQELLNTFSADLADDGAIAPALRAELDAAQRAVDSADVRSKLATRLANLGSDAAVPDLDAFLDHDLDGVANRDDNCVNVANADQADADTDTLGDACDCGSGTVDPGEACDDGNPGIGDGCRPDCTEELCGDLVVDPGEVCDDGDQESGDGCRADCAKQEVCGDGEVDAGEACDDHGRVDADGCEADCSAPACGNGIVDPGEVCFGERAFPTGTNPYTQAAGDMDGDGALDVVVAGSVGVGVLLGDGQGALGAEVLQPFDTGSLPMAMRLVDLDADDDLDVVTIDPQHDRLLVLLNDGAGVLGAPSAVPLASNASPSDVDAGDVDEDGYPDIVVSDLYADDYVLLPGLGDGTLGAPVAIPTGAIVVDQPTTVRLVDLDGDDHLDLLGVTLTNQGVVALALFGDGTGGFPEQGTEAAGAQADGLATADLDLDGDLDAVSTQGGFNALTVLGNDGAGNLSATTFSMRQGGGCQAYAVSLADFTGDGMPDALCVCGGSTRATAIYEGDGVGGFVEAPYFWSASAGSFDAATGDFDEDGASDFVFAKGAVLAVSLAHDW